MSRLTLSLLLIGSLVLCACARKAAKPACPPSYQAASGFCAPDEDPGEECRYPEGTCHCGPTYSCSGARQEEPSRDTWTWICKRHSPEVREDGCPGKNPEEKPCEQEGQECQYGSCCVHTVRCVEGTWRSLGHECPP